jgi:hypothetical protein
MNVSHESYDVPSATNDVILTKKKAPTKISNILPISCAQDANMEPEEKDENGEEQKEETKNEEFQLSTSDLFTKKKRISLPKGVSQTPKSGGNDCEICSVCNKLIEEGGCSNRCGHSFHLSCIKTYLEK